MGGQMREECHIPPTSVLRNGGFKGNIKVCTFYPQQLFYISFFLILVNIKKLLLKLVQI